MHQEIFQNEYMKVTDENESLKIWNYTGPNKENFYNYRGYITNHQDELVCPSFGHTEEILSSDEEKLGKLDVNSYEWFYSSEGTLCRIYWYSGRWYISTHKKLSAFDSRWSCKFSFGEIFIHCLESLFPEQKENVFDWFCEHLNKNEVYYFLLRCNSQNRIICNVNNIRDTDRCIYIGRLSDQKYSLNDGNHDIDLLGHFFCAPSVKVDATTILSKIENIDPFVYQGLIGFRLMENSTKTHVIKLLNSEYKKWMNIRGNNPNLRFRYLEIRQSPEMVEKLYKLYPKYSEMFDDFEEILFKLARKIYTAYIERYIKNKYITLPKEEYLLLKKCHDWFLQDKLNNKIFTRKVLEFLNSEPPLHLYKMIKRYQAMQKESLMMEDIHHESEKQFFSSIEPVVTMVEPSSSN